MLSSVAPPPPPPARAPTFHRTQSSPILHFRLAPTSSSTSVLDSFPPPPQQPRPPPPPPELAALASLPLPVLVFEPSLRLHSINRAGRNAFGLAEGPPSSWLEPSGGLRSHPGGADQFFWSTSLDDGRSGDSALERIRAELLRLSRRPTDREWSHEADVDADADADAESWLELKSGAVPGLKWCAEVRVTAFAGAPGAGEWYSVLIVRPLQGRPPSAPKAVAWPGATPRVGSASFSPWDVEDGAQNLGDEYTKLGGLARPVGLIDDRTEGSWAHAVPAVSEAPRPRAPPPVAAPTFVPPSPPASVTSTSSALPNRPYLPLRLPTLPPATPPLSSAGSRFSDRSSLLSGPGTGSSGSRGSSRYSALPASAGSVGKAEPTPSIGITVSSAGIQLAQSVPQTFPPTSLASSHPAAFVRRSSSATTEQAPPVAQRPPDAHLLQFAALAQLPNTGIIIADVSLSSGHVNALARSLLMGISPPSRPAQSTEDWWLDGAWSNSTTSPTSDFFTSSSTSNLSTAGEQNPFEFQPNDLTHAAIIAAGEARVVDKHRGVGGSSIRLGKPSETNRYRTTVAGILYRSAGGREGGGRGPAATGKKPYRMFDSTFSQRIIDPLEPLLEICARRGQKPESYVDGAGEGGAVSGMVVGIEVDVDEADGGLFENARRKRVRRSLVEASGAPIVVDGKHLGGILVLRDVTDKGPVNVGRAHKLVGGEAYFKHILDHMPQMVWTTTPLGSHDFFNCQWYNFTGLEPEQSLGLGWQNPFHEEDMPQTIKAWTHSLETGDPYSVEYRCRRHDGVWRWMLGRALPFRDAEGTIKGWFGTCTDVDEFVNIRSELARTQKQFTAILKGAEVLIWAIDADYTLTFCEGFQRNEIVESWSSDGQVVGKNLKALWPDSTLFPALAKVLEGKETSVVVEWATNGSPSRKYRCSLTPLSSPGRDGAIKITGAIVVSTDVTDLTAAHERLQQSYIESGRLRASEEAAIEASRLKSEFVANISHEIRTPIAGMIGMAELLLDETDLQDSHRVQIGKIMRSGEILLEMVGMVLDMGKVEAGKLELEHRPFKLSQVVKDAQLFSLSATKKGLVFTKDIAFDYAEKLMGDMPRLRQVLTNLLSNAIKFTSKGTITLRVKQLAEDTKSVRVRFEVEDTGVGIKEEAVPLLFQPFHQADASTARMFGGTGLGLCIAKNLVELMGGTIALSTKYGTGTRMTVEVPLEKAPLGLRTSPVLLHAVLPPANDVEREKTWILVTDDNELNREIITKLLLKMRFNVEAASNGLEAIEALNRRHFDLVLMDGQMPLMDGFDATLHIRQSPNPEVANVIILALTASAIAGDRERFIGAGMNGYLSKPVRSKVLEATILDHLRPPLSLSPKTDVTPPEFSSVFDPIPDISDALSSPSTPDVSIARRRPSHPSYSPAP